VITLLQKMRQAAFQTMRFTTVHGDFLFVDFGCVRGAIVPMRARYATLTKMSSG